jgi:hypothetical protein
MTNQTKLIDFVAAFITALSLWCLSLSFIVPSVFWRLLPYHFKFALAGVTCFAIVTLLTFLIPEKLRTHIGWLIIAILGLAASTYVKEQIQQATQTEQDFFEAFSPFPLEFYLFLLPSLIVMGVTHYLAKSLLSAKQRMS